MYPILIKIGPLSIYSYGLMVALGFLACIYLAQREARMLSFDPALLMDMSPFVLLGAVAGARAFFVMSQWQYYKAHLLEVPQVWHGGLVIYGGSLGALLMGWLWCRKKKAPLLTILDALSPYLPLGEALGRIGCFLNGCCYGALSSVPWAVTFPHLEGPRHPTQLYFFLNGLVLGGILMLLRPRRRYPGHLILYYFLLYPSARFFLEFFRGDIGTRYFGLGLAQVMSLVMAFIALTILLLKRKAPCSSSVS